MKKIKIPILEISNLFVSDKKCCIEHFNLSIPHGDSFAVLCGREDEKKLFLEVLSGKHKPEKGKVFFGGDDVTGIKNRFGVVFGESKIPKFKTVAEYVAVPVIKNGLPGKTTDVLVRKELPVMGLSDYADKIISSLPQNIIMRTELFAAYMCSHKLIVIDEPFSSLETEEREAEIQRLVFLRKNMGVSLLVVTDNVDIAVQLSDVVAVVGKGLELKGMVGVDNRKLEKTINKIEELSQ